MDKFAGVFPESGDMPVFEIYIFFMQIQNETLDLHNLFIRPPAERPHTERRNDRMKGTLYGVGVGPGDPRLMTYLAVETIIKCPVIAVPSSGREGAVSYRIAAGIVKGLDEKKCLELSTPMTKDRQVLGEAYGAAAEKIAAELEAGKDVAYLTLGDPTIYSTYIYIHRRVRELGYDVKIVNGVPSFCAASAELGDSLADRSEQLHIIPSTYEIEEALELSGTRVLMKAASRMPAVKEALRRKGLRAAMVENCGMENQKIYADAEEIPEEASYYSLVVVKEGNHD